MKDGIPSGRTLEDVVNEVRKQAFYLKGKSVNDDPLDDLEDPLNKDAVLSSIFLPLLRVPKTQRRPLLHHKSFMGKRIGKNGFQWSGLHGTCLGLHPLILALIG